MKYVRFLLLSSVGLLLALSVCVRAQNSPYTRPEDNVGSWSWDKPSARSSSDSEEREPGETSWERMQAEQQPEVAPRPRKEILRSLAPLGLWRWWRGEKPTDATAATASAEEKEPASEEPPTEEE